MNARYRYFHQEKASIDGFTIIELLVSMAIFVVLGVALAMFMNTSIQSFTMNTARKEAYSAGSAILGQLESDLTQAFLAPGDRNKDIDVKFISEIDSNGSNKLVFVIKSPNAMRSGSDIGLNEIAWFAEYGSQPPFKLCRNERQRIGGEDSLFNDPEPEDGEPASFSDRIAYFSLTFFPDAGSLEDEGNPLTQQEIITGLKTWDSTRGVLSDFELYEDDSYDFAWDDVLPERIRIIITILPSSGMKAYCMEAVSAELNKFKVDSTNGFPSPGNDIHSFLIVDNEWMKITAMDDESFEVERGARNTIATGHESGALVRAGYTFTRTVFIPCHGKAIR